MHPIYTLPFGLTWSDLAPALAEHTSWTVHTPGGLHKGNSYIVATDNTALFVKQTRGEAAKYQYLADHGVPTPRLLHVVERDHDEEIIVLECLQRTGIEPSEADDMLQLIARINAVTDPPQRIFPLPPGRGDFDELLHAVLDQIVVDTDVWFGVYRRCPRAVAAFPRALNHGEMYFQQVGHTDAGELVVFDLETMALRPRFTDIANVLSAVATMTGRPEQSLFADPENWNELLWTRLNQSFGSLPWLFNERSATPTDLLRLLRRDAIRRGLIT